MRRRRLPKKVVRRGFDRSLIECNLRRTVAQRLRDHDRALNTLLALRQAVETKHAGS